MKAFRLRLRFVPGVSIPAATYGSSTFGGNITYGQRATDPVPSFRYRVVPLPAGMPTSPAWLYREHDTWPAMKAQVLGNDGPLDLTSFGTGFFVLTPLEPGLSSIVLPTTVVAPAADGVVTHVWDPNVDPEVHCGTYRVVLIIQSSSGRRGSLPHDDNLVLVVNDLPVVA